MPEYFFDCCEMYCRDGCNTDDCPIEPEDFPCPKQEKLVNIRCPLGVLMKDEVDFLAGEISDPDFMIFRRAEDIPLDTPEKRLDHLMLVDRFNSYKAVGWSGLQDHRRAQMRQAVQIQQIAEGLIRAREEAQKITASEDEQGNLQITETTQDALTEHLLPPPKRLVKQQTAESVIANAPDTQSLVPQIVKAAKKMRTRILRLYALQKDIADIAVEEYGSWMSQDDYATIKDNPTIKSLRTLRETAYAIPSKTKPGMGVDRSGNIFQKIGDRDNDTCQYFVFHDSDTPSNASNSGN